HVRCHQQKQGDVTLPIAGAGGAGEVGLCAGRGNRELVYDPAPDVRGLKQCYDIATELAHIYTSPPPGPPLSSATLRVTLTVADVAVEVTSSRVAAMFAALTTGMYLSCTAFAFSTNQSAVTIASVVSGPPTRSCPVSGPVIPSTPPAV